MKIEAAVALIFSYTGKILSVSRKDDPTDFNLPGGKIEPGETSIQAAIREIFEETGLHVGEEVLEEVFIGQADGIFCSTFLLKSKIPEEIMELEQFPNEGVVAWKTWEDITGRNTYAEYNRELKQKVEENVNGTR